MADVHLSTHAEAELAALEDRHAELLASAAGAAPRAPSTEPLMQLLPLALTSVAEEETSWREGASALEQRWRIEAEAMAQRWRSEDEAGLRARIAQAGSTAAQHEVHLASLPPRPRREWGLLLGTVRLRRLDADSIARCFRDELHGCGAGLHFGTPPALPPASLQRGRARAGLSPASRPQTWETTSQMIGWCGTSRLAPT